MLRLLQRLCPHRFGWSYIPSRRRRFCRVCAQQQRLEVTASGDELSPEGATYVQRYVDVR